MSTNKTRILRGGGCDDGMRRLHSTQRDCVGSDYIGEDLGFRLVRTRNKNNKQSGRIIRGGSFFNLSWHLRSAGRSFNSPGNRGLDLGFRLVRVPNSVRSKNERMKFEFEIIDKKICMSGDVFVRTIDDASKHGEEHGIRKAIEMLKKRLEELEEKK